MGKTRADLAIEHGTVITPLQRLNDTTILVADGRIVDIRPSHQADVPPDAAVIDAGGKFVVPGFIDIHVNGGGGGDALDGTHEALSAMCRTHARGGTTSLVPTVITAPMEKISRAVEVIGEVAASGGDGAEVLGAYVEGPFLSSQQKGAHNPNHLRIPAETDYSRLLELAEHIRMVALAPELPGAGAAITAFKQHGVRAAVAHSQATYDEVMEAVDNGLTHVSHLFSSMSQMFRKPGDYRKHGGVTEAALLSDDLSVELVGDGYHVPKSLLRLAVKNKPEGKLCVVTDAMRAAGKEPGTYILGDLEIIVEDGIALLPDRSVFAGSVCTMDTCLKTLTELGGMSLEAALRAATMDPARIIGVDDRKGSLHVGKDADIVILDQKLRVTQTLIRGKPFQD
ncbi:MAG: N-acetylglucosamine-6-phosphate deacetylase [Spirochaetota bacterium]